MGMTISVNLVSGLQIFISVLLIVHNSVFSYLLWNFEIFVCIMRSHWPIADLFPYSTVVYLNLFFMACMCFAYLLIFLCERSFGFLVPCGDYSCYLIRVRQPNILIYHHVGHWPLFLAIAFILN